MIFGRITKLTSAALLGLGLFAGAANAATTFQFFGPTSGLGPDERYVEDGLTLDVTSSGGDIHQNRRGIGVTTAPNGNRLSSNRNTNESLTFVFSQTVTLLSSVVFEHRNGVEAFDILDDAFNILGSFAISGPGGSSLVTLSNLNLSGDTFIVRHTSGSGIRIRSFDVTPVPVPAALPMAFVAFGALAFVARRRKAA